MAQFQGRSSKLVRRKKTKQELGSDPVKTKVSEIEERKNIPVRGGGEKTIATKVSYVNVSDAGKTKKVKIVAVEDNPANKDFKRESVLSMGGVVETELGKTKITSRPSQDGVVNGVLVK